MVGRQVIITNREFTLEELKEFMDLYWDKEEYNVPVIGRPTKASIEEYILLPATERFLTIVYSRSAGGLFSKENKVILSTAENPTGALEALYNYMPVKNTITKIAQTTRVLNTEKERKGPAEDVLQAYTAHMKDLLEKHGYLK